MLREWPIELLKTCVKDAWKWYLFQNFAWSVSPNDFHGSINNPNGLQSIDSRVQVTLSLVTIFILNFNLPEHDLIWFIVQFFFRVLSTLWNIDSTTILQWCTHRLGKRKKMKKVWWLLENGVLRQASMWLCLHYLLESLIWRSMRKISDRNERERKKTKCSFCLRCSNVMKDA